MTTHYKFFRKDKKNGITLDLDEADLYKHLFNEVARSDRPDIIYMLKCGKKKTTPTATYWAEEEQI